MLETVTKTDINKQDFNYVKTSVFWCSFCLFQSGKTMCKYKLGLYDKLVRNKLENNNVPCGIVLFKIVQWSFTHQFCAFWYFSLNALPDFCLEQALDWPKPT